MGKKDYIFAVISFLCFLSIISNAQAPNWLWAKSAGGTNYNFAYSVAVDASGNVYVAGMFNSFIITFGSYTLTNAGNYDIFLAKYDANGNVLWVKSAGGIQADMAYSVAVDASGNVYVAGIFSSSTITFGAYTLANTDNTGNSSDIFLAKYDANGNVLWAKSAGGTFDDESNSVAVDASGNIYVAGFFYSPTITFSSYILTNTDNTGNSSDIFLAKYDANGNVLWAKSAGGTSYDEASSVAVDASGNAYMAGWFESPILPFGFDTLTNSERNNIFLAKYDANGNVLWAKSAGGMFDDQAYSVAVDASGNAYMAGYSDSPILTFGSDTLTNTNDNTMFLAKYDANGNVLWAKIAGGTNSDYAYSVAVNACGNTYVTGYFSGSIITFGSYTLTTTGGDNVFVAKYDANGNVLWAKSSEGTADGEALSNVVDTSGNVYLAGDFYTSTITFGSDTLTNAGQGNMFLVKIGSGYSIDTTLKSQTICQGSNYNFYGTTLTTSGTYYHTLVSSHCCDSIIKFQLTVNPAVSVNNPQIICNGGSYVFNGHTYTTTGNYHDTLTTVHGCDSIITTQLTVNSTVSLNNPQTICNGGSYVFNGHTYTTTGNYHDTLTTVHGCDSIITIQLTVNPALSANNPQTICNGGSYVFNGHTYTTTGTYHDTLTTVHGCDSIITTRLTVDFALSVNLTPAAASICEGNYTVLSATGATTYTWNPSAGLSSSSGANVTASPAVTTTYIVRGEIGGCTDSASVTVSVIENNSGLFIPNGFTPNGDGFNDVFKVVFSSNSEIENFDSMIFNRWGIKIYEWSDVTKGWDGTYNGRKVPEGVYVYVIKATDDCGNFTKYGTVTVLR